MAIEEVRRIKAQHAGPLLSKSNVVACGVGYKEVGGVRTDELCVIVSVA